MTKTSNATAAPSPGAKEETTADILKDLKDKVKDIKPTNTEAKTVKLERSTVENAKLATKTLLGITGFSLMYGFLKMLSSMMLSGACLFLEILCELIPKEPEEIKKELKEFFKDKRTNFYDIGMTAWGKGYEKTRGGFNTIINFATSTETAVPYKPTLAPPPKAPEPKPASEAPTKSTAVDIGSAQMVNGVNIGAAPSVDYIYNPDGGAIGDQRPHSHPHPTGSSALDCENRQERQ